MNNGWIKLHRQILEWEWFDDNKTYKLFTVLLLLANHKETKWRGETVLPGQILTGRKQLSEKTRLTEQEIRTSIKKLKKSECVTIKSTNKYSLITVNNWDNYQGKLEKSTSKSTNNQPTSNHIQEGKEGKEINNYEKELEEIIIAWNNLKDGDKNFSKTIKSNNTLLESYKKRRNEYKEYDDFKKYFRISVNNYIEEIKKRRDETSSYFKHRFSLLEFLERKGGFNTFINKG